MFRRILIVSPTNSLCGAGQFRHDLAVGLQRNGYSVTIAQPAENTPLQERERALAIRHEFFSRDVYEDQAGFANDKYQAAEIICRVRPDLIIFSSGFFAGAHRSFFRCARFFRIPYILVEHQVSDFTFFLHDANVAEFANYYKSANAVIAVSDDNLRVLRRKLALPEQVGRVIPCGRPAEFFAPRDGERRRALRAEWKIPADALAVVTVAKLEQVKGHALLIKAIERMKRRAIWNNIFFIWIGDGSLRAELERDLSEAGVGDHVRMLGFRWDVASLYDACDVFALLSLAEGMPLTVMEAMAKGLPPLCTDAGGTAKGIADAGIILGNPHAADNADNIIEAFISALEKLAADPAQLQNLAEKARRRAASLFTEQRMIGDYVALIGDIAKQASATPWELAVKTTQAARGRIPAGDYVSPNLAVVLFDHCFPNMASRDAATVAWPDFRREIPHNFYCDKRWPDIGFLNRDEAHILYNTALRFAGKHALEIGCHMGWSTCHLAMGGIHLDVIDPALANSQIIDSVRASLQAAHTPHPVVLYAASSPEAVEQVAKQQGGKKWSLIFIDGNHERPGPLNDAIVCAKHAERDAAILFHDLVSPAVAEGLGYLRNQGWNVRLYHTTQMMAVAWRGNVVPVDHRPDPSIKWTVPAHLLRFVEAASPEQIGAE